MVALFSAYLLAALVIPLVMKQIGREGFNVAALIPLAGLIWTIAQGPAVLDGHGPVQSITWVEQLSITADFRLDTLSWIMALLVNGIGFFVLVYCSRYFSKRASGLGRFAGFFLAFAGSMFGLVTTDNTMVMYVMWELTTVFSFLLIGHYRDRRSSRRAAMEAIIVTTFGGLAMLGGLIILGELPGGAYSFTELIASAKAGTLLSAGGSTALAPQALLAAAIVLVLLGALSKSAIFPFHFWLPAAMAAPTPTSAYLHAAAMVKAGVYLVARLAPGFSGEAAWQWIIVPAGLFTMILGGYRALRQFDTKLILAYGTVSQLGFLTVLVGHGSSAVALAGLALIMSHALFKACLFLCVGVIDWATGTRDLRELSGVGRKMPILAVTAAIGIASMAGIPPTAGYVGKEAALHALTGGNQMDMIVAWVIVAGSVLTLAYGLRFLWGAFATKPGVEPTELKNRSRIIIAPPSILAALSLVLGLIPASWENVIAPHANQYPGEAGHLTLWGGFGLPVIMTVLVVVVGPALFIARSPIERLQSKLALPFSAEGGYRRIVEGIELSAGALTSRTQSGSQPMYLTVAFLSLLVGGTAALSLGGVGIELDMRVWDSWAQSLVVVAITVAAILAARSRRRLKAVLLVSVVGYGIALIYEIQGAPDLALTQVLVETLTLVVFVLVLRSLPAYFSNRPMAISRWFRAILGALVGVAVAVFAVFAANSRKEIPVSSTFADEAYQYGYGRNVVNVTLVDIRAWDTMGEISVVVACAIGVASLLFIRDRAGRIDSLRNLPTLDKRNTVWSRKSPVAKVSLSTEPEQPSAHVRAPGRNLRWLPGSATVATSSRSVVFEVGTRLIYHTLLIVSLYFLFAGHNQPGGGFAGGLMAGLALAVRYLASGRYELGAAMPIHPGYIMGTGLFTATTSALVPIVFGGATLQTAVFDFTLPGFGPVHLATAIIFDVGVYLVVVGLVLDVLRSLGAEIDRHGEMEALDDDGEKVPEPSEDRRREETENRASKEGANQ